jgi:hypothetical protein
MNKYVKIKLNPFINENIQLNSVDKFLKYCREIEYELKSGCIYILYDDEKEQSSRAFELIKNCLQKDYSITYLKYYNFNKNKKMDKKLPVTEDVGVTQFPYITMFLPALLTKKNNRSWFNCNFINIFCINDKGFYNYVDDRGFFRKILRENSGQLLKLFNFNRRLFIDSIMNDYYIYVWIDSYYTGNKFSQQILHDSHPILIYGVNTEKQIYYCYKFSLLKGLFKCEYDIDILHRAIEGARCDIGIHADDFHIDIFKLKELREEKLFQPARFLNQLNNYIFSKGNCYDEYFREETYITQETDIIYGLDVTKNIIDLFRKVEFNYFFDYRLIHLITENKMLINDRIKYVIKEFDLGDKMLLKYSEQYDKLVFEYESVKNFFIKSSLIESGRVSFYKPPQNQMAVDYIVNTYEDLIKKEKAILLSIYDKFVDFFTETDYSVNCYYQAVKKFVNTRSNPYLKLSWRKEKTIKKIQICNIINDDLRYCDGNLTLSDGTEIISNCFLNKGIFQFEEPKTIKWLKFYPVKYFMNEKSELLIKFNINEENLLNQYNNISSSSIYQKDNIIFSDKNVLKDNGLFWCPDPNDKERYIEFELIKPIDFNTCYIWQDCCAVRVNGYKIEYYKNNKWEAASVYKGDIIGNPHISTFQNIKGAEKVKLIITNTMTDTTGYDMPNIVKFKLFNKTN